MTGSICGFYDVYCEIIAREKIMRPAQQLQSSSLCVYPEVTKTCAYLGIDTMPELWDAVQNAMQDAKTAGLSLDDQGVVSKKRLYIMLRGRRHAGSFVNPWNVSRKSFHPLAVYVGFALGRHPVFLFGSPNELAKLNRRVTEKLTQQQQHIHRLMRDAYNPLTGQKGLEVREIGQLASVPGLRGIRQITMHVDSASRRAPFSAYTGNPRLWADDLACILNVTAEDVFPLSAAEIGARKRNAPMYDYTSLRMLDDVSDPDHTSSRIEQEKRNARFVEIGLSCLGGRERKIIDMRFFKNMTLEECGHVGGVSKERIRQIEKGGIKRMRMKLRGMGLKL